MTAISIKALKKKRKKKKPISKFLFTHLLLHVYLLFVHAQS